MKKQILVILVLCAAFQANAQQSIQWNEYKDAPLRANEIRIGNEDTSEIITMKTDTMTVRQSFALLNKICKNGGRLMWMYDRKVIYKGQTYFKFGWSFNHRKHTYLIKKYKMNRVNLDTLI